MWQDWAIPLPAMHALMEALESDWCKATQGPIRAGKRMGCKSFGVYTIIAFCGSFCGNEDFFMDLYGIRKCIASTELNGDYVIIPLLLRFKGECYQLTPPSCSHLFKSQGQAVGGKSCFNQ